MWNPPPSLRSPLIHSLLPLLSSPYSYQSFTFFSALPTSWLLLALMFVKGRKRRKQRQQQQPQNHLCLCKQTSPVSTPRPLLSNLLLFMPHSLSLIPFSLSLSPFCLSLTTSLSFPTFYVEVWSPQALIDSNECKRSLPHHRCVWSSLTVGVCVWWSVVSLTMCLTMTWPEVWHLSRQSSGGQSLILKCPPTIASFHPLFLSPLSFSPSLSLSSLTLSLPLYLPVCLLSVF